MLSTVQKRRRKRQPGRLHSACRPCPIPGGRVEEILKFSPAQREEPGGLAAAAPGKEALTVVCEAWCWPWPWPVRVGSNPAEDGRPALAGEHRTDGQEGPRCNRRHPGPGNADRSHPLLPHPAEEGPGGQGVGGDGWERNRKLETGVWGAGFRPGTSVVTPLGLTLPAEAGRGKSTRMRETQR